MHPVEIIVIVGTGGQRSLQLALYGLRVYVHGSVLSGGSLGEVERSLEQHFGLRKELTFLIIISMESPGS
jgi:hypothetical protein